jgi:hypothetical protein
MFFDVIGFPREMEFGGAIVTTSAGPIDTWRLCTAILANPQGDTQADLPNCIGRLIK